MTDTEAINSEKQRIRSELRERRRALSEQTQRQHALQLRDVVQHQSWFQEAETVALYWACDGEIDLEPLLAVCRSTGKRVYMPRILAGRQMRFLEYRAGDRLQPNRYGIREPGLSAPAIEVGDLDIIFAPLVAFTDSGERLGMGGGYYDRALAGAGGRSGTTRLIGVAHSCQRLAALPVAGWDVRMSAIVTEQGPVRA